VAQTTTAPANDGITPARMAFGDKLHAIPARELAAAERTAH
jgi:hypothetical protein